jgi:hypothetical protein
MARGASSPSHSGEPAEAGPTSFVRRTERQFWLDPDGKNRWTPALDQAGKPLIEDREGAGETCSACSTEIRWLCFVVHPTRGAQAVGLCCIHKVIGTLPPAQQTAYREAVRNLNREMENAARRAKGEPLVIGREERRMAQIAGLEAAARDPRLSRVTWFYNDNPRTLGRDVRWYLSEMKARRRHSSFQSGLKTVLARNGYPDVFAQ